ncbi:MAG: ribosomal RNA small subunit methyltransferase A [Xanthomonadaceae bacterium]|nr:ribosomal RNA small subunit methyltransferase A [Xanthomonadaceae bacterium]
MHRFKKKLGQNFLHDANIARKIIDLAALTAGEPVFEIGPGNGFLTAFLLGVPAPVTAIETDTDLLPVLRQRFSSGQENEFTLVHGDVLKSDLEDELGDVYQRHGKICVVANIPYQITTPIIFLLIRYRHLFSRAVLMMQEEVAARILAAPGSKLYGRLSIMTSLFCQTMPGFTVSPGCFYPQPRVWSRVVSLHFLSQPSCQISDVEWLGDLVKRLFSQRRKKIINPLSNWKLTLERSQLAELLLQNGFSPDCRPETMTVSELCRLAELLQCHVNSTF